MHLSAACRRRVGVDTSAKQWMAEINSVTVDLDDALVLRLLKDRHGVGIGGARDQLQRGCGQAGGRKQRLAAVGAQSTQPGAHQFCEAAGQRRFIAPGVILHGASQFQRVERIAARKLLYSTHFRPRERPAESLGQNRVRGPEAQRTHPNASQTVRPP